MSYKTILVHAGPRERVEQIAGCAARLAVVDAAHVVGLASTGLRELLYQSNAAIAGVPLLPDDVSAFTGAAQQALARFTATVTGLGVPAPEARMTNERLADSLIMQSRYSDLVVMGQAEVSGLLTETLPQEVILHCPRPVVVVPRTGQFDRIGERPLLAWDGGMAASRAIMAAMPFLQRAALVTLTVFNPREKYGAHGEEPGADLANYLARHGVKLDVVVREAEDAGEGLLSLGAELGADLLVMGCYGHTRFRELLLGGVTRLVLHRMTLPVLMTR